MCRQERTGYVPAKNVCTTGQCKNIAQYASRITEISSKNACCQLLNGFCHIRRRRGPSYYRFPCEDSVLIVNCTKIKWDCSSCRNGGGLSNWKLQINHIISSRSAMGVLLQIIIWVMMCQALSCPYGYFSTKYSKFGIIYSKLYT